MFSTSHPLKKTMLRSTSTFGIDLNVFFLQVVFTNFKNRKCRPCIFPEFFISTNLPWYSQMADINLKIFQLGNFYSSRKWWNGWVGKPNIPPSCPSGSWCIIWTLVWKKSKSSKICSREGESIRKTGVWLPFGKNRDIFYNLTTVNTNLGYCYLTIILQ